MKRAAVLSREFVQGALGGLLCIQARALDHLDAILCELAGSSIWTRGSKFFGVSKCEKTNSEDYALHDAFLDVIGRREERCSGHCSNQRATS